MKNFLRVLSVLLVLVMLPVCGLAEDTSFNSEDFIDWFNESYGWMTVANGHWSSDPADQVTDEQLEKIFSMATKQQNAVHWTPYYFIVVKDVDEQRGLIGNYWGPVEDMATEGTVTIIVMADQILTQEQGHVTPYESYYMPTTFAYYDTGLTCGMLGVAAASLGYKTHYFGTINGEYAPKDLADGKYQSMSRYIKDEYQRTWGFRSAYGSDESEATKYPVSGNCVFVCAIVLGKEKADETVETWGTNHARPHNWVIWDGVPNTEPSPAASPVTDTAADAEKVEEVTVELAENQYLGTGTGIGGDVLVRVTMDGDKIANVEVVAQNETEGIGDKAIEAIPAAIVAANSADVDVVASATVTSEAIIAAVKDALSQVK